MRQPQRLAKHFDNVKNVNCQDATFSLLGWDPSDQKTTMEKSRVFSSLKSQPHLLELERDGQGDNLQHPGMPKMVNKGSK